MPSGVVLWLVTFFGLPRPLWLYVFGHELTHAIWVMIMGGRVHRFVDTPTAATFSPTARTPGSRSRRIFSHLQLSSPSASTAFADSFWT